MDDKFMKIAIREAIKAKKAGDFPFGAVIVKEHQIISKGRTREISKKDVTAHAELEAMRKASRKLNARFDGCVIYCTGEPCPMCASSIFQAKIKKIVVGITRDDLPDFFRKREIRLQHLASDVGFKVEIKTGLFRKEIIKLFEDVKR